MVDGDWGAGRRGLGCRSAGAEGMVGGPLVGAIRWGRPAAWEVLTWGDCEVLCLGRLGPPDLGRRPDWSNRSVFVNNARL